MYTEEHREQLRDFIKQGLARVAVFFETTYGLPHEITLEKINSMKTTGEQMQLLENMYKKHPKIFTGMPRFIP